jgi:hypothetical protein
MLPHVSSPSNLSIAERWALVNRRVTEQDANASLEHKFQQTAALMASVRDFGWTEALAEDDERVRQMWTKLRGAKDDGEQSR